MKISTKFGSVLFIILFSYFLILMDNSIIFTSTVKIANDLGMNQSTLAWISNAYTITFGGFLLLGGWLTSTISWRAGFLINVPFAGFLLILTVLKVQTNVTVKKSVDYVGAVMSVILSVIFVYGISISNLWMIILAAGLIVPVIYYERRIKDPLIPMNLFVNRVRVSAYIVRFIFMMAMLTYWFILPQIMQQMYHFSPLQSGMGFLPLTIVNFIAALYLPRLSVKISNHKIMLLGQSILLLGVLISAISDPQLGYWTTMGLPMILIGIGQGWLLAPLTAAGIYQVDTKDAGAASGMTNVMHQLGGPVGLSVVVLFTAKIVNLAAYYHVVMMFISGFLLAGLVILIAVHEKR